MPKITVKLRNIAFARSGDKGSSSNIGVIAYTPSGYKFLREYLTSEKVQSFCQSLGVKTTKRYELPNLTALNFVLEGILAGGGQPFPAHRRPGEGFGPGILEMPIEVDSEQLPSMKKSTLGEE